MANFQGSRPRAKRKKPSFIRPLIFLLLLLSVVAVQQFHLEQYLDQDRLRQFGASYGVLLPLMYLAVWTVGPLFLPGLPITLAGGVLFGPFWGVVYTAVGSTCGAASGLPGGPLSGPGLGGEEAARNPVDVSGRQSGPAWLEDRGLHPAYPRPVVLPVELRLRPHPDLLLALPGRHLRLHAALHHRFCVLLQQSPGPDPRPNFPKIDYRCGPGGRGEPHPGDLQMEEGKSRGTAGSLTARLNSGVAPRPPRALPPARAGALIARRGLRAEARCGCRRQNIFLPRPGPNLE